MQTIQSWLAEGNISVVDAKLSDHVQVWAQTTLRNAVRMNLEGPAKHFQSYGEETKHPGNTSAATLQFNETTWNANVSNVFSHGCYLVDSYDWLVNGTAQTQVNKLMEEEHSFDGYTKVCLDLIQDVIKTVVCCGDQSFN